jgi:hypothetical protein
MSCSCSRVPSRRNHAPPTDHQLWSNVGGKCKDPVSAWVAVPPSPDYVAMGMVFMPSVTLKAAEVAAAMAAGPAPFRCIRRDLGAYTRAPHAHCHVCALCVQCESVCVFCVCLLAGTFAAPFAHPFCVHVWCPRAGQGVCGWDWVPAARRCSFLPPQASLCFMPSAHRCASPCPHPHHSPNAAVVASTFFEGWTDKGVGALRRQPAKPLRWLCTLLRPWKPA